jgi:hypothetical protein
MADEPETAGLEQTTRSRRPPRKRGSTRTKTSSTSPGKIRRKALSKLVFDYRVQGHSVRAIAEKLIKGGYKTSISDVQRILQTELEALGASRETKEQARDLSLARLEKWLLALSKRTAKGDDKAISVSRALDERIAKYLGTEAPGEQHVKLTVLGQLNWIFDVITRELGPDATQRVLRRIGEEGGPPAPDGAPGGGEG